MERTRRANQVLETAVNIAKVTGAEFVGSEHLLLALLEEENSLVAIVMKMQDIDYSRVYDKMQELLAGREIGLFSEPEDYTPRLERIVDNAETEAVQLGSSTVGTEHLFIALLRETDSMAGRLLDLLGGSKQKAYQDLLRTIGKEIRGQKLKINQKKKRSNTPLLDEFSEDLTQLAREDKFDPIIGREKEIERIMQILSRKTKNNPCLIGEPGVGKTAITEGLASRIVTGNVPVTLKDKRLVSIDLSAIVAGSKYRGEFEERIKKIIKEVKEVGNILLFIDEIHTMVGAGAAEGAIDASNILKPSLARGDLQLIGATTINEYRKHIEKDSALERRFQPIKVKEPTEEESRNILYGLRPAYEAHHHVKITDQAIEAAVQLSHRYITDRFLPDKAIDVMDEAAAKLRLTSYKVPAMVQMLMDEIKQLEDDKVAAIIAEDYVKAGQFKKTQKAKRMLLVKEKAKWQDAKLTAEWLVDEQSMAEVVSDWTGIPVQKMTEDEGHRLMALEKTLHQRVIGQDEAVKAVSQAVRRGRVGLKDPNKPIGSFLFLGPTGVGKTELSKALAEAVFGDEKMLVRVDMSEYMEKHSVAKFIGSPPGYVGHEEGGQLSEIIRRKPYSVILFDEVEKAHPDVFNILLQVLDDGHITDSQGRQIDFKNTIIIMTSNVGAKNIATIKPIGFGAENQVMIDYKTMKKQVLDEVKKLFRPEFVNRIDEQIVFHSLSKEDLLAIVSILFDDLAKRMKKNLGIDLKLNPSAKEHIVEVGYQQIYGARPLKRALQSQIEDLLVDKILANDFKKGSRVSISVRNGKVMFRTLSSNQEGFSL